MSFYMKSENDVPEHAEDILLCALWHETHTNAQREDADVFSVTYTQVYNK